MSHGGLVNYINLVGRGKFRRRHSSKTLGGFDSWAGPAAAVPVDQSINASASLHRESPARYVNQGRFPFSSDLHSLAPSQYIWSALEDSTGTIVLIPERALNQPEVRKIALFRCEELTSTKPSISARPDARRRYSSIAATLPTPPNPSLETFQSLRDQQPFAWQRILQHHACRLPVGPCGLTALVKPVQR